MFSSVESLRTKRAVKSLVAPSIMWIRYNFSPRPSSQSCSPVSNCTNSPRQLRRGRDWCTASTFWPRARHSPFSIRICRSASRPICTWCFLPKYSLANVGPKPRYVSCARIRYDLLPLDGTRFAWRRSTPQSMNHRWSLFSRSPPPAASPGGHSLPTPALPAIA